MSGREAWVPIPPTLSTPGGASGKVRGGEEDIFFRLNFRLERLIGMASIQAFGILDALVLPISPTPFPTKWRRGSTPGRPAGIPRKIAGQCANNRGMMRGVLALLCLLALCGCEQSGRKYKSAYDMYLESKGAERPLLEPNNLATTLGFEPYPGAKTPKGTPGVFRDPGFKDDKGNPTTFENYLANFESSDAADKVLAYHSKLLKNVKKSITKDGATLTGRNAGGDYVRVFVEVGGPPTVFRVTVVKDGGALDGDPKTETPTRQ